MFSKEQFRKDIDFKDCIGQACWIVSNKYSQNIANEWVKVFENEDGDPYSVGFHSVVVLKSFGPDFFEFDFFIDSQSRYHSISIKLPKEKVKHWVSIPSRHKYDYIFVEEEWHDIFWAGQISAFLFIDAIGMKERIKIQDHTFLTNLDNLSSEIDKISKKYNNELLFVSAADNIIVKANFNTKNEHPEYKPEILLNAYVDISLAIKTYLNCESYGIFTQGFNIYNEQLFSHKTETNHVNMRSLGLPFINIYEIEKAVRKNIRSSIHFGKTGYFERSFFQSLSFQHTYLRDEPIYSFEGGEYFAVDVLNTIKMLKTE